MPRGLHGSATCGAQEELHLPTTDLWFALATLTAYCAGLRWHLQPEQTGSAAGVCAALHSLAQGQQGKCRHLVLQRDYCCG